MRKSNKLKVFNDPIYGFIGIPDPFLFQLIEDPYFQRLRRISQMGLSFLVYPGAHHTRFHHALGSMHLMRQAISVLRYKGVEITSEEERGLLIAILLHDIGHGPFSHAMEHSIVEGVTHETLSMHFMNALNEKYDGKLALGIAIFNKTYPKKFLNQLVSSQLDMDRMDYLKRDSFYTGVAEGNINSERLITMLNVVNGELVVEEKGIYSVEKFLMARRFMYWQVYLHKTGLVAEQLLINTLKRAKELVVRGEAVQCSQPLMYFLRRTEPIQDIDASVLEEFALLDDTDILSALKAWQHHPDFVLSSLCSMLLNRKLLNIKIKKKPVNLDKLQERLNKVMKEYDLAASEAAYFVFHGEVYNKAYDTEQQNILILRDNGRLTDVAKASDHLNLKALSKKVTKFYRCHPKDILPGNRG